MGKMMKAVVKYDNVAGATEVREVPVPAIGPDDVLVETAYIGICGSDPHMHHNKVSYKVNVPLILGHEFAGTIAEIGSNVKGWQIGDRVASETHADYCGKCVMCGTNNYHVCRERKGYGFQIGGAYARCGSSQPHPAQGAGKCQPERGGVDRTALRGLQFAGQALAA